MRRTKLSTAAAGLIFTFCGTTAMAGNTDLEELQAEADDSGASYEYQLN